MPHFICPRCTRRGSRSSRTAGFSSRPVGCDDCGFGFLFELTDDYFPHRLAGILVCDQQGRIIAFGKGAQPLVAYQEQELIGQPIGEALDLTVRPGATLPGDGSQPPHEFALEWGVKVTEVPMTLTTEQGRVTDVNADFFPALDDDGGLLAVFTPA